MTLRDDIFALLDMLQETGYDIIEANPAIIAADIVCEESSEYDDDDAVEIQGYVVEWQVTKCQEDKT